MYRKLSSPTQSQRLTRLKSENPASSAVTKEILREHLGIYFKYLDNDYKDLKRLLGMEPLEITILKCGSFAAYTAKTGKRLRHVNPSVHDLKDLVG